MRKRFYLALQVLAPLLFYEIVLELVSLCAYQFCGILPQQASVEKTAAAAVLTVVVLGCCYRRRRKRVATTANAVAPAAIVPPAGSAARASAVAPSARAVAGPVFAGIGACVAGNLVVSLLNITSPAYQQARGLLYAPDWSVQMLCLGIVIPAAEELVFRGLGFWRLREEMSFLPAAVLSALLFACFHGNMVQGIYTFAVGLLLAWSCEQYHALWQAMVIHMAANLTSVFMSSTTAGRWIAAEYGLAVIGISIVLLIAGMTMMKEKNL